MVTMRLMEVDHATELALFRTLLDEVRQDELALREKHELVRLLRKRLEAMKLLPAQTVGVGVSVALSLKTKPRDVFSELAEAAVQRLTPLREARLSDEVTFSQRVQDAVLTMGSAEFVVGQVYEVMASKEELAPPADINPKIATVLSRLAARGLLRRTVVGGGSVPNRYCLNQPEMSLGDGQSSALDSEL